MADTLANSRAARFGLFEVDLRAGRLLKSGLRVRLPGQSFEILAMLLVRRGDVLTRDEIRERLWPEGTFVDFDHSLNSAISRLRDALGDSADNPRFVETLPRRGYRFLAPVEFVSENGERGTAPAPAEPAPVNDPVLQASIEEGFPETNWEEFWKGYTAGLVLDVKKKQSRTSYWYAGSVLALLFLAGLIFVWQHVLTSQAALVFRIVPFATFPGDQFLPSFSPDGNQVAFIWTGEKGDSPDLYVKLVGTDSALRLTNDGTPKLQPVWTPDGRYILFLRFSREEAGIYRVPAIGGPEEKVLPLPQEEAVMRGFNISPDGKEIVYSSPHADATPHRASLHVYNLETQQSREITSPAEGNDAVPAFSPDGSTIAFIRSNEFAVNDIYLIRATGGAPRRLTNDHCSLAGLAWSADGRELIFASNREGPMALWRVPVAGGTPTRVAAGTDNAYLPAVAQHGHRMAFVHYVEDTNIWRMSGIPAARKDNPSTELVASTRPDNSPNFSLDGKRIAFQSERSGSCEIWVCNSDGSEVRQLTSFGGPHTGTPRWSPDGIRIAFDSRTGTNSEIFVVDANGGKPRQLTFELSNQVVPSWSAEGKWVYFSSDRTGQWEIWKIPAVGGDQVQLTRTGGFNAYESSDGKTLYFSQWSQLGVWQMPVSGGEPERVLNGVYWGYWAVNREGIYYLDASRLATNETPGANPAIVFYSFKTRRSVRLGRMKKEPITGPHMSVSWDGRWVLYTQVDSRSSEIMLVENFR